MGLVRSDYAIGHPFGPFRRPAGVTISSCRTSIPLRNDLRKRPVSDALQRRVLVADDDSGVLGLVHDALQAEGYEVLLAADGEEALALAISHNPDAVLLDIMMPGLDGLAVCRHLRDNPATSHLCVIMLTARGLPADQLVGLDAGADDYIPKPFDAVELPSRIESVIARTKGSVPRDPLTRLPTAGTVDEMRGKLRDAKSSFALMYVDLDGFASFATQRKERGDTAVRKLAACVHQVVDDTAGMRGLVGHIAADRLAIIVDLEVAEATAAAIVQRWDSFVSKEDDEVPPVSIGVALCGDGGSVEDSRVAAEMTHRAKATLGSAYAMEEVRPSGGAAAAAAPEPQAETTPPLLRRAGRGGMSPRLWDQLAALNDVTRGGPRASLSQAQHPRGVLIVDDDADIRDLLRLHCELQGFPVIAEASSGRAGVELAELHKPAFVLLDYRMPYMDGEEAAARIRAVHSEVKIIAFSAILLQRPTWADAFLTKNHIAEVTPLLDGFVEMGAAERRR